MMVNLDVVVVMTGALAMDRQPDADASSRCVEVVAEVGLPSEASDRQGARFEGRIATNAPIVAAHHAGFEVKFVGHDHAEVAAVGDLPGEVEPAPARVA